MDPGRDGPETDAQRRGSGTLLAELIDRPERPVGVQRAMPAEAPLVPAPIDEASPAPGRRFRPRGVSEQPAVSVVIPTLNEALNLPHVLPRIPSSVDEVVLVDGGSEDGTVEVAMRLLPEIRIVREVRRGKGVALQSGFRAARGDIIVTLDADGSTDPEEIPAFVGCLLAGADFAKGSRFAQGGGTSDMERLRKVGNWGLRLLVRIGFGGRYSDLCYGYNAMWRHVLPLIQGDDASGFEIETLMNIRALAGGLRVAEVPSYERERIHGESHLRTFMDGARVLRTILRERKALRSRQVSSFPVQAPGLRLEPIEKPVSAHDSTAENGGSAR